MLKERYSVGRLIFNFFIYVVMLSYIAFFYKGIENIIGKKNEHQAEMTEIQECIDSGYTMYLNGKEISPVTIAWKNRKYDVEIDNDNSIILVTY